MNTIARFIFCYFPLCFKLVAQDTILPLELRDLLHESLSGERALPRLLAITAFRHLAVTVTPPSMVELYVEWSVGYPVIGMSFMIYSREMLPLAYCRLVPGPAMKIISERMSRTSLFW